MIVFVQFIIKSPHINLDYPSLYKVTKKKQTKGSVKEPNMFRNYENWENHS